MYSKMEESTEKVCDLADAGTIAALMTKFGPCPKLL